MWCRRSSDRDLARPGRVVRSRLVIVSTSLSAHHLHPATSAPASATSIAATTSTTTTDGVGVALPDRWVGGRIEGDDLAVVVRAGDSEEVLGRWTTIATEGDPSEISDIGFAGNVVLMGMCCEPSSGSIFEVRQPEEGGDESEPLLVDQGYRFDVKGTVFVRADSFTGILGIRPLLPSHDSQWLDTEAHAADVSISPDGDRSAVLVDPVLRLGVGPVGDEASVAVYLVHDGEVTLQERMPVETNRYCAVVWLADGQLGLLASDHASDYIYQCTGDHLDLLDVESGEIEPSAMTFATPVRHLGVDDSGHYLIATTIDGTVTWHTREGEHGVLAEAGFQAADW